MKIYYAHPINTYGTDLEKKDLDTLSKLGFTILNPNELIHQEGYQERKKQNPDNPMSYFIELVESCEAFAFRTFPDNTIGAGVGIEMERANELGLPIIQLPSPEPVVLSVEQTRVILKLLKR